MAVEATTSGTQARRMAAAGKYLTFMLCGESYGVEILKVQEIIGMMNVTRVPRTPAFVRGVINLRGKVIPVVDLRLKFDMEAKEDTERTCIIVVQVVCGDDRITMGAIVDEVSEVMDLSAAQIEEPPSFGASVNTDFIMGVGKVDRRVVMLLDVDRVLSHGEISAVNSVAAESA
mgnify:CR=1 FL=1